MKRPPEDIQLDMRDLIEPYDLLTADVVCGSCGKERYSLTHVGDRPGAKRVFAETLFEEGWRAVGNSLLCSQCMTGKADHVHKSAKANQRKRTPRKTIKLGS